jgi:hypothetical protein
LSAWPSAAVINPDLPEQQSAELFMARTNLREVLEAIGASPKGLSNEKDAVALLDLHLGLVQGCQHTDSPASLIKVRDGARKALETTFKVRTDSLLARSHADPLEKALAPLERLIERTQTEDKPEKERFDKRWDEIGARVGKLQEDIQKTKFGASPGKELESALDDFTKNAKVLMDRKAELEFALANKALDGVEKSLAAFDKAFAPINDKAKEEFLKVKDKLQKDLIPKMDLALASNKFGDPPHDYFKSTVNLYRETHGLMEKGERQNDYPAAKSAAKGMEQFVPRYRDNGFNDLDRDWQKRSEQAQKLVDGIGGGAFPGADDKPLKAALQKAADAMKRVRPDYEVAAAVATFGPLERAVKDIRTAAVQGLIKGGAKAPKAARAKAVAMLKHDPEAMNVLNEEPGGKELLDSMVTDLGGKAKDADSKAFVRSAITARFGTKLDDKDLTTKYLPRLYKVLGMVPGSHTLDNPKLSVINRQRTKVETSGDYASGVINLKAPRTGLVDSLVSFGAWALPEKLVGKQLPGGVSQFDALTLHEVGHAVDDKKKFMDGKAGSVTFGGWQKHSVDEVAHFIGDARGFFDDFADLNQKPFLKAYLKAVLEKKKPQEDSTVTATLANGAKPDWKKLAKHAAVDHAENIRMKSDSAGLWDRGDSAAAKYAIGSSVFQQSYGHEWVSYALAARSAKVTDYQFRADGEWYAEAYAAFFLGKLKAGHPLHALLTKDKQSTESAKRAAR